MKLVQKILFLALLLFTTSVQSQIFDPVEWSFSQKQVSETEVDLIFKATIEEHWHMYSQFLENDMGPIPTSFNFDESSDFTIEGKTKEGKSLTEYDPNFEMNLAYFEHKATFTQRIKITSESDFKVKGFLEFMVCDAEKCLPPAMIDFSFDIKAVKQSGAVPDTIEEPIVSDIDTIIESIDSVEGIATDTASTSENKVIDDQESQDDSDKSRSILYIFFGAFASGLAALLTPCVFPMIPMTVSFFTKQSKSRAQGIRNAVFYGACIIVIYVILGSVVTLFVPPDVINELSTGVGMNIFFFILLVIFAISFMGAFEITLPSSWVNKADKASDKGGLIGIFFMALVLALVSFSCTGPIVGTLLVEAATVGGIVPVVGMFGFSLALALPFALFAAFPGWMNSLPKSGGWLNTVKVFLGFLELALAFKFLSNADLVVQGHYLEREMFLAIWIGIFSVLAFYLFGKIKMPHDSPVENLSVGRVLLGVATLIFVVYMIPGLWGAPLKVISGFPPSMSYSESPLGLGNSSESVSLESHGPKDTHRGPQNIWVFHDMDKGLEFAKKQNKPAFLDFTGYACVNCRKMEDNVWRDPSILESLKNDVVLISLYVDAKEELPIEEQIEVEYVPGKTRTLKTYGNKWSYVQTSQYKTNTQPYYIMLGPDGQDLSNGSADYEHNGNVESFKSWLDEGLEEYKALK